MGMGSIVLAFAGANALTGRVAAASPACDGVRVQGAPELAPEWADAVRELATQLPPVAESACPAVTLSVEPAPNGGARLAAMGADGRYAERTLTRPATLAATALGLVASIPQEPRGEADAGASRGDHVLPIAPAPATPTPTPSATATPSRPVAVWFGFSVGARLGEPTPVEMLDFEGRADAIVASWLLTLSFRYAPSLEVNNSDFLYEEIVIGIGAGRRIRLGRGALDVSILPALATMNLQWNDDDPSPASGGSSAFRLGLSARWSTPITDSWHFTITSDADVAPSALDHSPPRLGVGAPALPVWTAGLRFGVSGVLL
ncbi:MAG: hypothetical protein ACLQVI_24785 [Polyangiaceae bacterium]|jgi:hypothetical protein